MILVRAKIPHLDITDAEPRLRLIEGKDTAINPRLLQKSRILKGAVRRGDVVVVIRTNPPPVGASIAPKKARAVLKKKASTEDAASLDQAITELKSVHNLFMATARELKQPASASSETRELLTQLQKSVEGLAIRIGRLETTISLAAVRGPAAPIRATAVDDAPVFIPSDIRTGEVTETRIEVETAHDDSDLSDAEAALRALGQPKTKEDRS